MGNLVGHYARSSTKHNNTAKVSACSTYRTPCRIDSFLLARWEQKGLPIKTAYVDGASHTDLNLITTLTKSLLITRDKQLSDIVNNEHEITRFVDLH